MNVRVLVGLGLGLTVAAPQLAAACGACFSPPGAVTAVDSHRMVVSLSPEQTTLWDQIQYSGNPSEFVWVLPVPSSDAQLQLADTAFFTQLENLTVPAVSFGGRYPNRYCPQSYQRYASCGYEDNGYSADAGSVGDGSVQIFRQEVVGPYQTVVIGSEDPAALQDWLTSNGYNVPAATLPVLKHYTDAKNLFIVLRLRPGQGVQAMQPVRVTYPGFMGTFPLKMVTVGAAGALDITLWVVAEQRYAPMNYPTAAITANDLTWDWNKSGGAGGHDYPEVFTSKVEAGGGKGWVVQAAHPFNQLTFTFLTPAVMQDITVAQTGLPVAYLTRLRTRALVEHLADDLVLGPAAETSNIRRQLLVMKELNRPVDVVCSNDDNHNGLDDESETRKPLPCPYDTNDGAFCSTGQSGNARGWIAPAMLGLLAVMIVLRRRRS